MSGTAGCLTLQDLGRCERELVPLVAGDGAPAGARQDARAFNADLADLREALLEPFRGLVRQGRASPELGACLQRTVVELAFWRRVLVELHRGHLSPPSAPPDFLVGWLLS